MFKWKDYGENSLCFVEGISLSVASLKHKNMELTEGATGNKSKIKADDLNEAKQKAEETLLVFWETSHKEIGRILEMLNK